MSRITYIVLLLALWGCGTSQPTRIYEIPKGSLILTDDLSVIQRACKGAVALGTIIGCYTPATQTIYCSVHDLATCGHELLHHVGLRHEHFEYDVSAARPSDVQPLASTGEKNTKID